MSLPRSLHKYNDIASHLFTILERDTRRREFSTPAKAQRWRMRANMYRTLLEEENGSSLFSNWIFRITKAEPNVVTILTEPEDDGWFVDAEGNRVRPVPSPEDASLLAQAAELRRKIDSGAFDLDDEPEPQGGMDTSDPFGLNQP